MLKKLLPLALMTTLLCPLAQADEDEVRKGIEAKLGAKVVSVAKSPYLGLYEVFANGQIIYTDEKLSVIVVGVLIDGQTMKDHTAERMQKLMAIKFSDLPLEYAVKQVRGDGKRVFASFEDPNCGYCKKLARDIARLDNVTIYTFLLPILSPDSLEKSNQIWCASDKGKAWNDWMRENKAPTNKGNCDVTAIQKTMELGRRLNITGTPTIFFSNGERVPGAVPATVIEQKITQIATQAAASK